MIKAFQIILSVILLSGMAAGDARAKWFVTRKKSSAEQSGKPVVTPVVAPYDRLILNARGRITKDGNAFKIHRIGDKIYLEIRNDLFGGEVLLSSYLDRTGDLSLAEPGMQAMTPARYLLDKTDSLVLLRKPAYNIHLTDSDSNIARALEMSNIGATVMTFPIGAVNFDTTAVVFEATKLLYSNPALLDMTGRQLSGDFRISSSRPDAKFALISAVDAFDSGVSVSSETGIKLEATGYMGLVSLDMESTVALTAYFTLLPSEKMEPREADNRIGTGYYSYTGFAADGRAREGYFAKRLRLEPGGYPDSAGLYIPERPVEIYVDTLFSRNWYCAIKHGLESWTRSFETAGFRDAIKVSPYPAGDGFNANDPTLKIIRMGQGMTTAVTYQTFDDPRTGEIQGFTITVPRDYVRGLRRNALFNISQADSRYRDYYIPENAVAEALTADIIRTAGHCFGLSANYAGSLAYSPEQIRDPEFTREHGFTASAMDGIIFNHLATAGDRERGVQTVVSKPGVYDRYAIKWLYSPIDEDEKATLGKWLREKEGLPEYRYLRPQSTRMPFDPRVQGGDLGNDIFTSADRSIAILKFVTANADHWLADESIPDSYKSTVLDYAVMKFDEIVLSLCAYVGGIYINETMEDGILPRYVPVSREVQKKAMLKVLSLFDDLSWLDSNSGLIQLSGRDKRISEYVAARWPVRYLMQRILGRNGAMRLSVENSTDPYTEQEALSDLSGYIFRDIRRGMEMDRAALARTDVYIEQLIGAVPVLKSNYEYNLSGGNSITALDDKGLFMKINADGLLGPEMHRDAAPSTISTFDYYQPADQAALYTQKLKEVRALFSNGLGYCRSQFARDRYAYYISKIDKALRGPEYQ